MTDSEYRNQLEAVIVKFPDHPDVARLRTGNSAINRLLLRRAMEKLRAKVNDVRVEDPNLKALAIRKTRYFRDRAKLSNTFLDAQNKIERAAISREIDLIQATIEEVMVTERRLAGGAEITDEESAEQPMTPLQRRTRIQSLRSMRSRKRKALAKLQEGPRTRKSKLAIERLERRIEEIDQELSTLTETADAD